MRKTMANDFPQTDAGNAELIAAMFGPRLRFDHNTQRWLCWRDGKWTADCDGETVRMAKPATRIRLSAASRVGDDEKRESAVSWALRSESRYCLHAAIDLAKSTPPIADPGTHWDRDPFLLGVQNGVLDLIRGELRQARPEDRITIYSGIAFDPLATCARFERFMVEVFQGDDETISFVQRAIGYSLTGNSSEHCLFLCCGHGCNGKSTLLEIVRTILGGYAHNLPFSAFELTGRSTLPNDVAGLRLKRFVTAVETNENIRLNEGRIKALTGGDCMTARFLYKEYFSFDSTAKLWLAFNHRPQVTDNSHGFWRRIRLIPFDATFTQPDKTLLAMLKLEASGILNWALRGCLLWQEHGLGSPPAVAVATAEYRKESDPLSEFLDEGYTVAPQAFVASAVLRADYETWLLASGAAPMDHRSLSNRLRERGFVPDRSGRDRVRGWRGLRRKADVLPTNATPADTRTDADAESQQLPI